VKELPKTYDPAAYEDDVYAAWEKAKAFRPASDADPKLRKKLKPYTIIMPPPNVTGILHAGHALMLTLEDILVRYHRMKGFDTLWLPGTDHAAIATENKVIEKLSKEGQTKERLGRAKFLTEAKKWASAHKHIIEDQTKAMGASADWSRNAFTMDATREKSVKTAFHQLYKKGLIYRGDYMVNWCPYCQTVLADDEVEHKEQEGVLYYMKYGPFTLGTTRPETKVGDTAVAVHPDDKRYKKYVGEEIEVKTINGKRKLKVIADEMVDPEFGTGVVKITPFHDKNDYEAYRRHPEEAGPPIEVIDEQGKMTAAAGKKLAGLDRFAARKKMVDWLKKEKLLVKEEVMKHSVGRCYRSDDVIEPRISRQWFLKVTAIKEQAITFVDDEQLKFVPNRFEKTYRDWLTDMHDWCISRQVWFGHPIPAFENAKGEISLTKKPGFKPSTDTLDTWFSSALWPFSTMGWPGKTKDFERFFPGDVLETGYEIIFFWIARMVLMTVALDVRGADGKLKPPFHTVYLNGIVRDDRGRKFSKSLGNGVDPLKMIGKYGTDAFRFTLATSNGPGADIKFDEKRIVGSRNFANKLWNIARFILAQEEPESDLKKLNSETLTTFDRAILHKLRATWLECERVFYDSADYGKAGTSPKAPNAPEYPRAYDLAHAGNALYSFLWSDFADWYVEAAKVQLKDEDTHHNTNIILRYVLATVLKLLHPYMPFITETIWQQGVGSKEMLITTKWPELHEDLDQPEDAERYEEIKRIVETIRRLRVEKKIAPGAWPQIILISDELDWLIENADAINKLAHLKMLRVRSNPLTKEERAGSVSAVCDSTTVALPLAGLIDEAAEAQRLQAQIDAAKIEVERLTERLANKAYVSKAPEHVVAETKAKLAEAEARLAKLEAEVS
jgi:valyl-tRNA synthetase